MVIPPKEGQEKSTVEKEIENLQMEAGRERERERERETESNEKDWRLSMTLLWGLSEAQASVRYPAQDGTESVEQAEVWDYCLQHHFFRVKNGVRSLCVVLHMSSPGHRSARFSLSDNVPVNTMIAFYEQIISQFLIHNRKQTARLSIQLIF